MFLFVDASIHYTLIIIFFQRFSDVEYALHSPYYVLFTVAVYDSVGYMPSRQLEEIYYHTWYNNHM